MGNKPVNAVPGKQGFQRTGRKNPAKVYRGPDAGLAEATETVAPTYGEAYRAFAQRPAQQPSSLGEWVAAMRVAGDARLSGTLSRADHAVLTRQADQWLQENNYTWDDMMAADAQPAPHPEPIAPQPPPPRAQPAPAYRANERRGSKWTPGYRPAAEIARDIRNDLKEARKAGEIPRDVKISVRVQNYSGGRSIRVGLSGWPSERIWSNEVDAYGLPTQRLTDEADQVRRRVEAMREAYNRDASDPQTDYFDVDYYGNTEWDWRNA